MKKLRLLGIWLLLLALLMTACGAQADITPESPPGYTAETQQVQNTEASSDAEVSQTNKGNGNLPIYGAYYYDLDNVVLYLEVYGELPANYITKAEARALGWEGGSVEKYM